MVRLIHIEVSMTSVRMTGSEIGFKIIQKDQKHKTDRKRIYPGSVFTIVVFKSSVLARSPRK